MHPTALSPLRSSSLGPRPHADPSTPTKWPLRRPVSRDPLSRMHGEHTDLILPASSTPAPAAPSSSSVAVGGLLASETHARSGLLSNETQRRGAFLQMFFAETNQLGRRFKAPCDATPQTPPPSLGSPPQPRPLAQWQPRGRPSGRNSTTTAPFYPARSPHLR
eukprot:TRINITY_DN2181_c0_g1_i1.p2 TRINITY_DN2181_c0_g1~~TRINITY_DN2181_c0_g1_i1.p2  ORF type:complete len:170 (-),score=1.21 TRINITY_DN2181_c0_g1_i1:797-1285(-)